MCLLSEQLVAERLPPRLLEAYHLLTPGARVADIGCDHGLLSIALVGSGRAESVYACDVSPQAIVKARSNAERYLPEALRQRLSYRQADGLSAFSRAGGGASDAGEIACEIDEIALCGLGVPKLLTLLEAGGGASALGVDALVIQPLAPALPRMAQLRSLVHRTGWRISRERFLYSNRMPYMTLRAERGAGTAASEPPSEPSSELSLLLGDSRQEHAHLAGYSAYVRSERDAIAAAAVGVRSARAMPWRQKAAAVRERERWAALLSEWLEEVR